MGWGGVAVNAEKITLEYDMAERALRTLPTTDTERAFLAHHLSGIWRGDERSVDKFWRLIARIKRAGKE
jgi:hypothetical protein